MKANFYFLLTIVLLVFTSCEKDEDSIVGNWKAINLVTTSCNDASENVSLNFNEGCSDFIFGEICIDVSFAKNGTYVVTTKTSAFGETQSEKSEGSWEIVSGKLNLCEDGGECELSPYTLDNNILTFSSTDSDGGCKTTFKVKKN